MKIGLLNFENIDLNVTLTLQQELTKIFPNTKCLIIKQQLKINQEAFNKTRNQHNSTLILNQINTYAQKKEHHRILGLVNVDLYAGQLSYVFGEAYLTGKAALISLLRLRNEFYNQQPDSELFTQRTLKEAVHEVGHTLGLDHCSKTTCVMHFSNSIADTDKKQTFFCDEHYLQTTTAINQIR
jgi:archaemetzincin